MSNPTVPSSSPTALPLAELAPGTWTLDPQASTIAFRNKTMWGLVTVKGKFAQLEGHGEATAAGTGQGSVTVAGASVDTKHKKRDVHLRSADFFDVESHPSIVFTATQITPTGRDTADVSGELTVRGTAKPLTFTARAVEVSENAVVLAADLTVARTDFGITWNQLGMMKGPTELSLNLRFTRQ